MFKFFVVLCLGVLAVQAVPQLKAPIDDLVKQLDDLNREATDEQHKSLDKLSGELKDIQDRSEKLLHDLGDEVRHDVDGLKEQIKQLEDEARQARVDIQECVGNSEELLDNLPERAIGETGSCLEKRSDEASMVVNEANHRINEAVGRIEGIYRQLEECQRHEPRDQDVCISQIESEIRREAEEIPAEFRLAVDEASGHLENEKAELLLCVAGKAEGMSEAGQHIVRDVTECADRILPPGPGPH